MPTESLKKKCIIGVANLLINYNWLYSRLYSQINPFSCFPSQLVEELISVVVKVTSRGELMHQELCPLLKSGRVKNFELCDVRIRTEEFVSILNCLGTCGYRLIKLIFCRVQCIKSERAKLLRSEAVENLLRLSPNIEHLYLDIPIDIDVLKFAVHLKWLELRFFPRVGDLKSLFPQCSESQMSSVSNLQHVSIFEGSQHTIPVDMIASLLQYTPQLLCLENNIAEALELLHGQELDNGTLCHKYKLRRIILGNSFLEPDRSPASLRAIKIAALTCPDVTEMDLIVNNNDAVMAISQMKQLHTIIIQWADVIPPGDFQKGYHFLIQTLGRQLRSLGIIFFKNVDFGMIISLCHNLVNLKVIFEMEICKFTPYNNNLYDLQTLHLECMTNTGPSANLLIALISNCPNVKMLFLIYVPHFTDSVLFKITSKNNLSKLQDITIVDCNLTIEGLQWLLKSCPLLETMRIRSSMIILDEALPIVQSLNTKVKLMCI
ncbi:uncharacterized protein LOC111625664 [Centruroides sculpturatus]|uniref:uncharacterized protein LOC111625664 n=1 Tax=Centruroides sculpturatus TaxID=218467 RepID=UPI000C6D2E17|nr:uncharacterized protein LOC111625664 [Centruroides sculpturatus]